MAEVAGTVYGVQARKNGSAVVEYRDDMYCTVKEQAENRVWRLNAMNEEDGLVWEVYSIYPY